MNRELLGYYPCCYVEPYFTQLSASAKDVYILKIRSDQIMASELIDYASTSQIFQIYMSYAMRLSYMLLSNFVNGFFFFFKGQNKTMQSARSGSSLTMFCIHLVIYKRKYI